MPGPQARNLTGLWLFLGVLFIYSICPPFISYDSYWSVPTALSIIRHGSTAVDEFVPSAPVDSHYGLECVPAVGPPLLYKWANGCPGGHWYNLYPIGVPVLALPLIFLLKIKAAFWGPLVPKTGSLFGQTVVAAFFSGDLVAGHSLVELWCASTFGAIAVWLQYRIASRFLPRRQAVWLALLFAFGTSEWSIASRNLFPQGLTVLLLSAALYLARAWLWFPVFCRHDPPAHPVSDSRHSVLADDARAGANHGGRIVPSAGGMGSLRARTGRDFPRRQSMERSAGERGPGQVARLGLERPAVPPGPAMISASYNRVL